MGKFSSKGFNYRKLKTLLKTNLKKQWHVIKRTHNFNEIVMYLGSITHM